MNPKPPKWLAAVRVVGFVLLALAALVTTADEPPASQVDVVTARLAADTNEEDAESAPQQQVVNGWEAADLLDVIATRSVDNRLPRLVFLLVLAVCWAGATSGWARSPTST